MGFGEIGGMVENFPRKFDIESVEGQQLQIDCSVNLINEGVCTLGLKE